ncbi:Acyl transferase domain-containing protein [Streptomyces sp. SceaMP-e96]|uniref:type I polyketide synthase n=1 Tax=unclassified Streptomyces TaxID=2593676 RepID=UPI000823D3E2|nr:MULTISPECIES: type I polyketide synthase [unclassified Streptomyces]MYT14312.1 acyltransferase domain-containing protein [Streptomyces sp. SID4951]SCK59423.1 Acyl transferase domain-containing protein [Streptomyces sp. SceaMP-e96]
MTLCDGDLTTDPAVTGIAVVGMAGRFPGAEDIDAYWRNLRDGVESITRLAEEELLAEGIGRVEFERPEYVRAAPLLDGVDLFDARFFGFSAREAALLDPQQRLFLECAWHALEHAGIDPGAVRSGGVFAGANMPAYLMSNLLGGRRIVLDSAVFELQIHNDKDYLATRTAHQLGFTGPALSVQTACSTSLVAVHEAAQSLRTGACDVALAGGVCVRVPHRVGYRYERGLIYSPDGHCRPFDAEARGTVFGSGVGVVVLKRLADAMADGDRVLAVLKGSAVNNDGSDKVGYTSPGVTGQEQVVLQALRAGGVDARTVTAVEAHGTATPIGDPIEINALTRAHRHFTGDTGYCAIGSVKSNIGHLETAAGIASLIKAVLQLQHRELAPSLHFRTPNPRIDFDATPFRVNAGRVAWEPGATPRRIGVSSFGIGGTNAHVVLEESPAAGPAPEPVANGPAADRPQLLLLSARTPQALEAATDRLAGRFAGPDAPEVADAAYTLQTGRRPMRHRRAVLVPPDPARAASLLLGGAEPDRSRQGDAGTGRPRTVFLFPGQGTQFPMMGHGLYTADQGFATDIDRSARLLHADLGLDLREVLYGTAADAERLTSTEVAQPALFATEYALARLLLRRGVVPDDMVGHSVGEFTAACVAGVLPLEDALHLVALRGRLMREQPPGAMLSVEATEETVGSLLPPGVSIAAVNAPALCVAAGPEEGVSALERALAGSGVAARRLHTSHAFHSVMMDPVVGPLTEAVRGAALVPGERPFVSGVTGEPITPEQATDPAYWGDHARRPVRFADAVRTAASKGRTVLVEVGPGSTLSTLSRAALAGRRGISTVRTMRRPGEAGDDLETLLLGLGDLWLAGGEVQWRALHDGPRLRTALPGYPFQRERHWIGPGGGQGAGTAGLPAQAADVRPMPSELDGSPAEERPTRPAGLRSGYTAPRDENEKRIVALWEEFLGFEGIGVNDDFFELGGHSLLGTQLVNRMRDTLGVTVSLRELLSHPTPAKLGPVVTAAMAAPADGAAESP